jgi:hypothetical protein
LDAMHAMHQTLLERMRLRSCPDTMCQEHGKNYQLYACVRWPPCPPHGMHRAENACISGVRFVLGSLTEICPCTHAHGPFGGRYVKSWSRHMWLRYEGQGESSRLWRIEQPFVSVGRDDLCDDTKARVWAWLCICTLQRVPHVGHLPREIMYMIIDWVINTDTCVWESLQVACVDTNLYQRCTQAPYVESPRKVDMLMALVPGRGLVYNGGGLRGLLQAELGHDFMAAEEGMAQFAQLLGNLGRPPQDHYEDLANRLDRGDLRRAIVVQRLPYMVHNGNADIEPGDVVMWIPYPPRENRFRARAVLPIHPTEDIAVPVRFRVPFETDGDLMRAANHVAGVVPNRLARHIIRTHQDLPTERELEAEDRGRRMERKAQKTRTRRQRKGKGKQRRPKHQKHQRPRRGTPRDRRGGNRY